MTVRQHADPPEIPAKVQNGWPPASIIDWEQVYLAVNQTGGV